MLQSRWTLRGELLPGCTPLASQQASPDSSALLAGALRHAHPAAERAILALGGPGDVPLPHGQVGGLGDTTTQLQPSDRAVGPSGEGWW